MENFCFHQSLFNISLTFLKRASTTISKGCRKVRICANVLMLQWPVCKIKTRELYTLEAFISSPTSPPVMNDSDSLDFFSQHLDKP